ncbi:MAG: hypothetical protein ACT4PV_02515 [Planctomycetaceae bacterium]
MKRTPLALLAAALLLPLSGCDDGKKNAPPLTSKPTQPSTTTQPTHNPPSAPAEVPAEFKGKIEREWPKIKEKGDALKRHFEAAKAARAAGNRTQMATEVEAGKKLFSDLNDAWAALYYSADDMPPKQGDACRTWLGSYDKQVKTWAGMAASLKQLSTS